MVHEDGTGPSPFTRRAFLACCAPLAASCARPKPAPRSTEPTAFPLKRFPEGRRVTVAVSGRPVEVLRTASGVSARSLLCTHQGCEVEWEEKEGAYVCPCHEGKFDAEGRPVEGPPPKPLATLPARIEGDVVLVGP